MSETLQARVYCQPPDVYFVDFVGTSTPKIRKALREYPQLYKYYDYYPLQRPRAFYDREECQAVVDDINTVLEGT